MFNYQLSVRGYELDAYGHVNHAVYVNYFEQARWEIFKQTGLLDHLNDHRQLLVVTEMQIRYSHELRLFDKVDIHTTLSVEPPYLVFKHKMFLHNTKTRVCSADVKTIFTDQEKITYDIPDIVLKALEL